MKQTSRYLGDGIEIKRVEIFHKKMGNAERIERKKSNATKQRHEGMKLEHIASLTACRRREMPYDSANANKRIKYPDSFQHSGMHDKFTGFIVLTI